MTLAISIPTHEATDGDLLARFAATPPDQAAFEALVHRHIHWVYAAALRITRDRSLAEDVTQAVLWSLAKKARALSHRKVLGGWLFEATRYSATTLMRTERRRKERERVLAQQSPTPQPTLDWETLQPRLDHAIARLPARDRDAILLRFLQRKTHEEIGALLGITPEAARKRITRALEKLRHTLGTDGSPDALGATLAAVPLVTAPSHLVTAVLAGKISVQAALLAKGVSLMSKALTLKLALAAAVLTVCAGYFVESYGVAQSTPAARSPAQTITVDGGPALGSNSMSVSSNGTTVTRHSNDGQHELTLTTVAGGDTTAQIKDADGKVLFNGPITTVADKAKVPADLLPLINGATRQGVLTIANPALFGMGRNTLTLDLIKQQLNPTDAEWTDMQDRIKTILTLQQYLATGNSAPSNTAQSVDAADAANPINGPVRDLSAALADSAAKPDDLESKLTALRAARIEVQDSLAKARHKLEDTLTPRQKAILVNLQILE